MKFYKVGKKPEIYTNLEEATAVSNRCNKVVELIPNSTDAAGEKHVPVIEIEGNKVKVTVGSVIHPMSDEHHIAWIMLETNNGARKAELPHDGTPVAEFELADGEKVIAAYEYCNLHGLWTAAV